MLCIGKINKLQNFMFEIMVKSERKISDMHLKIVTLEGCGVYKVTSVNLRSQAS